MRLIRSSGLLALAGLFAAPGAFAIDVTDGADTNTAGTLRYAINQANLNGGLDIIDIKVPLVTLTSALPTITEQVTIVGAGARSTVIQGANNSRIFSIDNPIGNVILEKLTVRGNSAGQFSGDGAGIYALGAGTLRLLQVAVENNRATLSGGGLYTESATEIKQSTFSGNHAASGGAVAVKTPSSRTLAGVTPSTSVLVENSTISGNTASSVGAGFDVQDSNTTVTIRFSTVAFNNATPGSVGAGLNIGSSGAGYSLTATLLAANNAASADQNCGCSFSDCEFTSASATGRNIETGSSCKLSGQNISNANVATLLTSTLSYSSDSDQTQTHAIPAGSAARDYALPGDCPVIDQRGSTRPTDSNGDGVAACEVGAFETAVAVAVPVGGGGDSGGGSGGGGGGGCTLAPDSSDPLLPALALIGMAGFWYRARRTR